MNRYRSSFSSPVTAAGMIGISFHNLTGTPPGSLVVGVGGGVPVRVIEVSEGDLVGVTDFEDLVPRSARVLVEVGLPGEVVASLPMDFSFVEAGASSVNILVPKTTVGGAEISSVMLDRVHPIKSSEIRIRKKIGFFIVK